MPRRPILVFDVNETLLDLDHLRPVFQRIFGDAAVMRDWFAQLILYSQTLTITGLHSDFGSLAVAVLRMIADIRGVDITDGLGLYRRGDTGAGDAGRGGRDGRRLPEHRLRAPPTH